MSLDHYDERLCYYFAYGSNMNPKRMHDRGICFVTRELAKLPRYCLTFNKRIKSNGTAAANVLVKEDCTVYGALYACKDDHVIQQLDKFEGVKNKQYFREKMTVFLENGKPLESFVYIAHENVCENGLRIHPEYLGHLLAAKDILPEEYFNFLSSFKDTCTERKAKLYFAYGADVDQAKMEQQGIKFLNRELGVLPGYKLCFNKLKKNGLLAPNLVIYEGSSVYGALYTWYDSGPFEKLDRLNGVHKGHYHRSEIKIQKADGEVVIAEAYFADESYIPKIDSEILKSLFAGSDIFPAHYMEFLCTFQSSSNSKV